MSTRYLAAALACLATLATTATHAEDARDPFGARLRDGRTTRGFVDHRVLHFTFDDGPRPSTTPRLLDELDEAGVRATFFLVARQLEGSRHAAQRELAREIVRGGHTVGSHTYDHANLSTLDDVKLARELTRSEEIFVELFGVRPWLIRPPYGARNGHVDRALAARGYTTLLWNLAASDEQLQSADTLVANFSASLRAREHHRRGPGGIVLLHDTQWPVITAFPRMIDAIHERNCELLERGEREELWDVAGGPQIFFQPRDEAAPQRATTVELDAGRVASRQLELRAEAAGYCRAR